MDFLNQTRFIERLHFFNGQRLFDTDMQGLEAFNREMRWLHNQSLHQPGIGNGYAIYAAIGDRQVSIGPGYAIDYRGREIVLTQTQILTVPPVASGDDGGPVYYDLTVSYPDDSDLAQVELRQGLCRTRGVVRLQEAPIFCWVPLAQDGQGNYKPTDPQVVLDIQKGLKIILARIAVFNCQVQQVLLIDQRRDARPDCSPYIACGVADPTDWTEISLADRAGQSSLLTPIYLEATVVTASGGFETVPCYSVSVPGERIAPIQITGKSTNTVKVLLIDQLRILDAQRDQLTVSLLVFPVLEELIDPPGAVPAKPSLETDEDKDRLVQWIKDNWCVNWMGVEG